MNWPVSPERLARGLYWQDTWKLVEGCTHVSSGCDHCWSARETKARAAHPNAKIAVPKQRLVEGAHFNGKIRLREDNLDKPFHRKKPTVYAIWNDLFHEDVPDGFIDDAFIRIERTDHIFLLLTKRADRLKSFMKRYQKCTLGYLPKNLWLGVSVEDQTTADARIPLLLQTPAAHWFVSYEPALSEVFFGPYFSQAVPPENDGGTGYFMPGIEWLIMGGESGPGARPMHPDWARSARDQCKAAGVPFFFKQWGEWIGGEFDKYKGKMVCQTAEIEKPVGRIFWTNPGAPKVHIWGAQDHYWQIASARVGKHLAGCLLDGVEHKEVPR